MLRMEIVAVLLLDLLGALAGEEPNAEERGTEECHRRRLRSASSRRYSIVVDNCRDRSGIRMLIVGSVAAATNEALERARCEAKSERPTGVVWSDAGRIDNAGI